LYAVKTINFYTLFRAGLTCWLSGSAWRCRRALGRLSVISFTGDKRQQHHASLALLQLMDVQSYRFTDRICASSYVVPKCQSKKCPRGERLGVQASRLSSRD